MSYDDAMRRAEWAASFIQHPYWQIVSRMLSGTIQNETEQALASDEHIAINRASVAMCRKVLQMPFLDVEQGRMAEAEFIRAKVHIARRRGSQSDQPSHEVQ